MIVVTLLVALSMISMTMAGECDSATVCGSDKPCAGKTMMEARTCQTDCFTKIQTCVTAKFDAAKMQFQTALMDAKTRFADAQATLQTKIADWKTKVDALKTATVKINKIVFLFV